MVKSCRTMALHEGLVFKNGDVYEGEYVKGKREGYGTYMFPDGEEVWKRKDYDVWLDYYLCQLCDIVTIYRKYNGTDYYSCYEGNRILLLACSVFCDGK